jgi:hypothetical protein
MWFVVIVLWVVGMDAFLNEDIPLLKNSESVQEVV